MKILNLYAGIGGNRKNWGDSDEITAVELDPKIAAIYQDFFPQDKMIVADAHTYLLEHFKEFDFIWSSPPCPTHSVAGRLRSLPGKDKQPMHSAAIRYPDMELYEEILLLQGYYKGQYCVENVVSWYPPLIPAVELGSHYFWVNFFITSGHKVKRDINLGNVKSHCKRLGFKYSNNLKRCMLRNCVEPETGKYIYDQMKLSMKKMELF